MSNSNDNNEYIPYYISNKPWYYDSESLKTNSNSHKRRNPDELTAQKLKHQRADPSAEYVANDVPRRGKGIRDEFKTVKEGTRAKNVCQNCGSSTHNTRDCLERPQKVKYKYRKERRQASKEFEVREDGSSSGWDEKRDRWHGYDVDKEYKDQMKKMQEKERRLEGSAEIVPEEDLDEDELEEMRELGLMGDAEAHKNDNTKDAVFRAALKKNPLAAEKGTRITLRSMDEKPQYLEEVQTGGDPAKSNPRSRVYRDLEKGYMNGQGQFVSYLDGEAEEFEKMQQFTHGVQLERKKKWEDGDSGVDSMTDLKFTAEASPTAVMMEAKKKQKERERQREIKKRELEDKYGRSSE